MEEEDPSKEGEGHRGEGAAWRDEEEVLRRGGNVEGTSFLEVEEPTLVSWEGPQALWEGKNLEVVVQRGHGVGRDRPWGPLGVLGVLEGVGRPSLDQLQGAFFAHQSQALCDPVHQPQNCFL